MTQEEKAKAYDEAYKKVAVRFGSNVADEIFLKEGEDERIRKALISFLKSPFVNENITDEKVTPWIAWLEKQGEQKPALIIPKFRVGDEIKTQKEESLTITKIDDKGYWSEDLFICDFNEECIWDLVEQKPAWSEEDETTKNNISHIIRQYDKISKRENEPCWYIGDCLLWMQNIKDRVQSQPQQEWSEEDELNLSEALHHIRMYNLANKADKLDKWLKSLKERYTWKPSEEQLKSLQEVIDAGHFTSYPNALETLYEQLKRLREK